MSGSAMCKTTSNFIYAQLFLLGEGIPDPGDIFNAGSSLFKGVADKIGLAIPGTNWIGQAADAYLNQNTAQQLRAKLMGDIDNLTGNLISNQAEHVEDTRSVLRAMKNMVDGCYKACKKLEKVWLIGDALSIAIAIPACALAMAVTGGALLYLTIMTAMNAASMIGLGGRLLDILTNLPALAGLIPGIIDGIIDTIWPPKLPDIPIPGFPSIPGLPEFTWPPTPGIPDFNLPIPGLPDFQWPTIPGLPDFGGLLPGFPDFGGGGGLIPGFPGFGGGGGLIPGFPGFGGGGGLIPGFPGFGGGGGLIPGFPALPGMPSIPNLFPGLPGLGDLFPGVGNLGKLPTWVELAALPDFLGGFAGMPALSFSNLLSFAQLPGVGEITSTMGQLQQLLAAGGGPGQLGSMAGQQVQMVSSQVQQVGQKDDQSDQQGAAAGSNGERAPVQAGAGGQQGQQGTVL
ncbi:EspA/EspE family type VII secretion system effector [Mycobacterium camsae]|uniref:EspA/EspE family type VII secretion system effector n=1 Tax=Mycobacterium gordonae TaxID=1778 RepID=UPI00197D46BB|nr:EspA/EspE family type VII secretion system effector [Mycobacterium gordonae]